MCLRFAVRAYVIGGWRSDAAQTRLYRIAYDWSRAKGASVQPVVRDLRRLVLEYAPDSYVRQQLLDQEINWYLWRSLKFFLYEYELHLNKGAQPDIDFGFFEKSQREKTVEHILPQTATSKYWKSRFKSAQQRALVHNLGNLVLTRDNSAYSNKDFPAKRGAAGPGEEERACYAQSPLRQEQELASREDWTPEEVLARQERLAKWALLHWAVELNDLEDEDLLEDSDADDADDMAAGDGLTVAGLLAD
jgi:hypothetical protein